MSSYREFNHCNFRKELQKPLLRPGTGLKNKHVVSVILISVELRTNFLINKQRADAQRSEYVM